jgi:nucleotide-binding universal stress UspA family protein
MPAYRRILVPRDFSPTSERALDYAIDLAGRTGADLFLMHAEVLHGDPLAAQEAEQLVASVDVIRDRLSKRADGSSVEATSSVSTHTVRDVAAAPAIVRFAEEHDIDLIVIGTHGRRGVRRLLIGSVTEEVMRGAPCEVLICREEAPPLAGRPVLVPIDFSTSSLHALQRGKEIAGLYENHLHVLHAAHVTPYPAFYGTDVVSSSDLPPHFVDEAEQALRNFEKDAAGPTSVGVDVAVEVGQPFDRIVEYARNEQVGLIVMGRRGLSGIQQILLGSNTERTLRSAPCAVLVTRLPPGARLGLAAPPPEL